MKNSAYYLVIALILALMPSSCLRPQSLTLVIIHSESKMYVIGDPNVEYTHNGARLNYLIPGAIVVFKTDYKILGQQGLQGEVYQISKDNILVKIGTVDTALDKWDLADRYLYKKVQIMADKEFSEIDLK